MKVLVVSGSLLLLCYLVFKLWRTDRSPVRYWFWPAVLLKITAGLLMGWLYTYYYEAGDTFSLFHDGVTLAALAREDISTYLRFLFSGDGSFAVWPHLIFKMPRALFMTKCVSVVNLLTYDNYWITSAWFSLASFSGAWILVKRLVRMYPQAAPAAVMAFLFFPSAVFWSAGIIKESLAMGCLFYISALFLKLWQRKRLRLAQWVLLPLTGIILWKLKYYYAGIWLPVAATTLLVRYVAGFMAYRRNTAGQVALWCGIFMVSLFLVTFFHPNFSAGYLLEVVVQNNAVYNRLSDPGNLIHYYNLEPSAGSVLINAPWALFSGLFRPFLWEADSVLKFLIALENLLLFAGFIMAFRQAKHVFHSACSTLVMGLIVYIVLLCIFLSLSTPNFGTLARYRVGFLPYFVFLIFSNNRFVSMLFRGIERLFLRLVQKGL